MREYERAIVAWLTAAPKRPPSIVTAFNWRRIAGKLEQRGLFGDSGVTEREMISAWAMQRAGTDLRNRTALW